MDFKREVGALISVHGHILQLFFGTAGRVDFPWEVGWEFHKRNPGIIFGLIHSHPPGMTELSSTDKSTLKAWTLGMNPFPVRMGVVTRAEPWQVPSLNVYYAYLQAKTEWQKGRERNFEIMIEKIGVGINDKSVNWIDLIWELSCREVENEKSL